MGNDDGEWSTREPAAGSRKEAKMCRKALAWLALIIASILSLGVFARGMADILTVTTVTCEKVTGDRVDCAIESRIWYWVVGQRVAKDITGARVHSYEDSDNMPWHLVQLLTSTEPVSVTPYLSNRQRAEDMVGQIDAFVHDAEASSLSMHGEVDLPTLFEVVAMLLLISVVILVVYLAERRRARARGTRHQLQHAVEGRE
jgi:hypothetical protein